MKIKKFSKINNVFSYSFFNWDDINVDHGNSNNPIDVFAAKNIIFGENGNGKSNLINIFKSLNEKTIGLEKHRDRKTEDQDVEVVLEDETKVQYSSSGWTSKVLNNKFVIFDKHYIENYVHSIGPSNDDSPERRQQRGKNIVYLGHFASYEQEINKIYRLKSSIETKNQVYLDSQKTIIETVLAGKNIDLATIEQNKEKIENLDLKGLPTKKDLFNKQGAELEKINKSVKEKLNILKIITLSEIRPEIELDKRYDISKIFSFTVAKSLLQSLHKISHKKNFVKEGLSLLTPDDVNCPFCEQRIKNGDYIQIIKGYQEIFNDDFSTEEKETRLWLSEYKKFLDILLEVKLLPDNLEKLTAAQQFLVIEEKLPDVALLQDDRQVIKFEINRVLEKEKNILDPISDSQFKEIEKIITRLKNNITKYNSVVKAINIKIETLKKDSSEGKIEAKKSEIEKTLANLGNDVFFLEYKESFRKYFQILVNFQNNKKVVESLGRIYQALKEKVVNKFNEFVQEYFELIKNYVKEISPTMEILEIQGQATYDMRNQQVPAQCGFCVKYNGEDCTRVLSEGEKQVVALAFFFAQLKKEDDKDKIVALDDPITSFDAGKRKSTAELIQKETKDYAQLFVLTCDPLFREYCLKQIDNRNFYYIFRTLGSSSIHHFQVNDAKKFVNLVCDIFEEDFTKIETFNGQDENIILFGQKLRFCLETKIKENYFGYSQDKFSNMIEQVASGGTQKFDRLIQNKDKILEIYKYCNTGGLAHYPRDGSTSWNELKDKIGQYLSLSL